MSRDRIIQLQECAEDLGFSTITDALDHGYHEVQDLVSGTFTLEKLDGQKEAHEAWLKEKEEVLEGLKKARIINNEKKVDIDLIKAIKFIEGVSHE